MSFTWFDKFTATVEKVPEDLRGQFIWKVVRYGTDGTEPDLEWPLDAIFESMREDIDNSVASRTRGRKGGRPKKAESDSSKDADNSGEEVKTSEKPDAKEVKTPEKRVSKQVLTQTKPNQASTGQGIPTKSPQKDLVGNAPCDPRAAADEGHPQRGSPDGGDGATVPVCPLDGTVLGLDTATGTFRCPCCGMDYKPDKVKFKAILKKGGSG